MPVERGIELLRGMSADRAVDALAEMDEADRKRLLAALDPAVRESLSRLLVWPENSAGGMMTTEYVAVPCTATVGETLQHIRAIERTRETIYSIFVIDPQSEVLIGTVSLRRLVTAEPAEAVMKLTRGRLPVSIAPDAPREEAARLIRRHDLLAVPVIEAQNRMLGIVTVGRRARRDRRGAD